MSVQNIKHTQPEFVKAGETALSAVLERSATDQAFRRQLVTNPRDAIAAHYGKDASVMPENFNVKFIENTAHATVVLPDFINESAQLSDEELETVAGGSTPLCVASAVLSVVASAIAFSRATEKLIDAL